VAAPPPVVFSRRKREAKQACLAANTEQRGQIGADHSEVGRRVTEGDLRRERARRPPGRGKKANATSQNADKSPTFIWRCTEWVRQPGGEGKRAINPLEEEETRRKPLHLGEGRLQ